MSATAFPIAIADHCAGVIEFFSHGISEPNPEVSAMFATVGSQLAQYLERSGAAVDGTRRWLDAAEAPLLALDAEGRVLLANQNACALAGRSEEELLGTDWVDAAVPAAERDAVRAALVGGGVRAEHVVGGDRLVSWQLTTLSEGDGVLGTWATGTVREAPAAGSLEARLRRALTAGELRLHYQPIFALGTGALVALEALLRWDDPVHGPVSPAEFIPLAEESGLIDAIGDWVLGAVCAQQVEWAARGMTPHISFNVSPSQLRRGDFIARVRERISAPGVDPAPADRRADRVLDDRGPGAGRDAGARAARARAADRPRRLRHRLLVAVAARRAAGLDPEDRPRVPARGAGAARGGRRGHGDPAAGERARPHGGRRGRGDRGAAHLPGARGLPAGAGLPARHAGAAGGRRRPHGGPPYPEGMRFSVALVLVRGPARRLRRGRRASGRTPAARWPTSPSRSSPAARRPP